MNFKEITSSLQNRNFAPVYALHGEEAFFIDQISDYLEKNVLTEAEQAFNMSVLYGKEVDFKQVLDHVRQYPVMAEKRLVIIKEAQSMKTLTELEKYIRDPNPAAILVIVHKHKKLDGRTAFYKALKKHGVIFESKVMREKELPAWINQYVGSKGMRIDPVAAEMLKELVGTDLDKLSNELDKLVIGHPVNTTIQKEQVFEEIGMSKDFNVFELQSALAKGDIHQVHKITRYFAENMRSHPLVMTIGILYSFFSKLYIVSANPNASDDRLAELLGYKSSWFVHDFKIAARRYRPVDVEKCIGILQEYDLKSKGMGARNTDDGELLKEMIDRLVFVRYGGSYSLSSPSFV